MAGNFLSVEQRLLCACARRSAQVSAPSWADVGTTVDWVGLVDTAISHGVAELLFAPLSSGGWAVPPGILADLERRVVEATGQGLQRTAELAGLMRRLDDRGLRALTFKGPALAAGAYGHVGRRLSSDLDLFVDRRDYRATRAVLLDGGYSSLSPGPGASRWGLHGLVPVEGRYEAFLPGTPAQSMIDLHVAFSTWRFGIRLDAASLFERATTVNIAGHPLPTLHPHDVLLVLAIHGMSHQWRPLRLVSDIDAVVEQVTDWTDVVARAEAAGMRRVLWVALLLAERLLGTALPRHVRARALADPGAQRLVVGIAARMFTGGTEGLPDARGWARSFLDTPYRRAVFVLRGTVTGWFTRRTRRRRVDPTG
jgi:hypothetical protein